MLSLEYTRSGDLLCLGLSWPEFELESPSEKLPGQASVHLKAGVIRREEARTRLRTLWVAASPIDFTSLSCASLMKAP